MRHEWDIPITAEGLDPVLNVGHLSKSVGFLGANKMGIDPETSLNL